MISVLLDINLPWELSPSLLQNISCLICGKEGQILSSIIVNGIKLNIRKCNEDELMWLSPRPDSAFYTEMYEKYFYNSTYPDQYGYGNLTDENRRKEKAKLNWDDIENESPIKFNKTSFLEIGSATGEMLEEATYREWQSVWGNELNGQAARRCQELGYNVFEGDYNYIKTDIRFELIFADNVIEHLMDPLDFVYKMSDLLIPQGMLCLRLPNTPDVGPRLKLIDHTYHFNPKSFELLLSKTDLKLTKVMESGLFHGIDGNTIKNMTVFCLKN